MRPRLRPGTIRGELTDGEVVVSASGGDRAVILNAMGDAVLGLCDGSLSVPEITAFVRSELRVPADIDVAGDVSALIDRLIAAGLIEAVE